MNGNEHLMPAEQRIEPFAIRGNIHDGKYFLLLLIAGRRKGLPGLETAVEKEIAGRLPRILLPPADLFENVPGEIVKRRRQRGRPRPVVVGFEPVADTDDRDIFGNAQPEIGQRGVDSPVERRGQTTAVQSVFAPSRRIFSWIASNGWPKEGTSTSSVVSS